MIFGMNADQLLALVFRLVNITQSPTEVFWSYKEYEHQMAKFKYPDGISAEDAENAVGQLDGAVDGVLALLNSLGVVSSSNLQGVVGDLLFTNEMVTKLASALYGALDTDKISLWGDSSGAHSALIAGITGNTKYLPEEYPEVSTEVDCIVDWFGPTDLMAASRSH